MVEARTSPLSCISRPGSAVDLLLESMGAIHAESMAVMQANIGAVLANMGAIHADMLVNMGAVGAAQVETREVIETVIRRLERLETSRLPKFVAGLDLNPSLSNEMTVAPHRSTISPEAKQGNPEVSTAPVVLCRSERLVNKPKVDYRQISLQPGWPISTAVSLNPGPVQTLYPSSSFAALQQHENPSAFETVPATLVERGQNVTKYLIENSYLAFIIDDSYYAAVVGYIF